MFWAICDLDSSFATGNAGVMKKRMQTRIFILAWQRDGAWYNCVSVAPGSSELARSKKTHTSTICLAIGLFSNGRPLFVLLSLFYVQVIVRTHHRWRVKPFYTFLSAWSRCFTIPILMLQLHADVTVPKSLLFASECTVSHKKFLGLLIMGKFEDVLSAY